MNGMECNGMSRWTYKSPKELCQDTLQCNSKLVFKNRACKGAECTYVPANESSHVATITVALRTDVANLDGPVSIRIGPMNNMPWSERLMASTALTGRTMVELCLPGVTWYLEESFVKEGLGS